MSKYPECEKLQKIQKESQACGSFYHWAVNKGYISNRKKVQLEKILAEYFEINLETIDKEKCQMLQELTNERNLNDTEKRTG